MRYRFRTGLLVMGFVLLTLVSSALAWALPGPRVAVLAPENRSGDPRYDYLGGIAYGLLLYDLSSTGMVELVDRSVLDLALKERELSLSAVAADPSATFMGILPADFLLAGEYVFFGTELRFTLKLVDVASTRTVTFSENGTSENLIHALAERVLERLTGKLPSLRDEGKNRSILSLRDETPGSIALFSHLLDAKVLLDGDFVGYTTGDRKQPFLLEGVEPGMHEVSTDLGRDFGVVKLPEISFGPWKGAVKVQSGKRVVVTDQSSHFSDALYKLRSVLSTSKKLSPDGSGRMVLETPFSFVDRTGRKREGRMGVFLRIPEDSATGAAGTARFALDGESQELPVTVRKDESFKLEYKLDIVDFKVDLVLRSGSLNCDLDAERNDIDPDQYRQSR